jgi:hypothetical protein
LAVVGGGAGVWWAFDSWNKRAQVKTKVSDPEHDPEQLIAMLNSRVDHWNDQASPAPLSQKLADVEAAKALFESDTLRMLGSKDSSSARVKQVVAGAQRFLDRADQLSPDQPAVRQRIALTYRQVGDFQSSAPASQAAGKQEAVTSYQRAAAVAASVKASDQGWAQSQLSELDGRLKQLGSGVDARLLGQEQEQKPKQTQARAPVPPRPEIKSAAVQAQPEPAENPELPEVRERLDLANATADRARRNLDSLRQRLTAQGQAVNPDTTASMARIDAFLQQAQAGLNRKDVAVAKEDLQRAEYELRKIFQTVGN